MAWFLETSKLSEAFNSIPRCTLCCGFLPFESIFLFDELFLFSFLRRKRKGGIIIQGKKYKSNVVNIRPPKWDEKFWIGKLGSFEDAQHVADAVYYYLGKPPFHFKKAVVTYPPLTCMGTVNGNPEVLSTQEMFSRYVGVIAKGEKFEPQREEFLKLVEDVTRRPDFPFLPSSQGKMVVVDDDDRDQEGEAPPMEFDEHAAKALQMSSRQCLSGVPTPVVLTHGAGSDTVSGSDALLTSRHAYVPSVEFSLDGSESILRSAGQSLGSIHFSIDDCPTTLPEGKQCYLYVVRHNSLGFISRPEDIHF